MIRCANSLDGIEPCDVIITDPPYSERCHRGHDATTGLGDHGHRGSGFDGVERRAISYPCWGADEVSRAVYMWHPQCSGWIVVITDHLLSREWERALDAIGRYVFAPIPAVLTGSSVRLSCDGPANWARWIVASRPKREPYSKWGALPGAYVGQTERGMWIGGKPLWLMRALVRDYSRDGDLVCDPRCGGGTTLRAAADLGRKWIGYDTDPVAVDASKKRMRQQTPQFAASCAKPEQLLLDRRTESEQ